MLTKDQHCLEAIIEATDRIIEYTSEFQTADDFNNDHRNFDELFAVHWFSGLQVSESVSDKAIR